MQVKPPPSLYKYETFSTQSLLNLKKQIIYFGSPLNFNDPYDCALTPNLVHPTDQEVLRIRDSYLAEADIPPLARLEFETESLPKLREVLLRSAQASFQGIVSDFLHTRGVACFSERYDDLLMWSHYGGKYKGFCLEFDTTAEPFQRIHRVRYVPKLPPLTVAHVLLDPEFEPILELFCTKSEAWRYEYEWRGLHAKAGTEFAYQPSALTGIYFGPDIEPQSLEIVCLVLAGQNESVKLWQGQRSTTEFKVNFQPFTYTPYLEAKRRGVRK